MDIRGALSSIVLYGALVSVACKGSTSAAEPGPPPPLVIDATSSDGSISPGSEPPRAEVPVERAGTDPPPANVSDAAGKQLARCAQACYERRQMEAVGVDHIRRTCQEQCEADPKAYEPDR